LTEEQKKKREERENELLAQLRVFLRSICTRLIKQFKEFSEPMTEEEAPGYDDLVVHPICLFDIRDKVNDHKYHSIKEFLKDIDLLVANSKVFPFSLPVLLVSLSLFLVLASSALFSPSLCDRSTILWTRLLVAP
jgi:hypothetical protein